MTERNGADPKTPGAGQTFINRFEQDTKRLKNDAIVDASGRDACGVGLIAAIDGEPSRQVVEAGIEALKALWHRGAVDADGMTGDGAGILVEIPQDFFRDHVGAGPATTPETAPLPSA